MWSLRWACGFMELPIAMADPNASYSFTFTNEKLDYILKLRYLSQGAN
jgi:hypothetical protein